MRHLRHVPALLLIIIAAILMHYYLPDRDIVRIVGTEVIRFDVKEDDPLRGLNQEAANQGVNRTRDVRLINTQRANGRPMVFRNEDTGWGWPPYLKFDSDNVFTEAKAFERDNEQWVAVRHYGWRIELFSLYPNATSMKAVSGPDVRLIPWFNIVFIAFVVLIWLTIWRTIREFKKKRIDPVTDRIGDEIEDVASNVGEGVSAGASGVRGFFRRFFGTTKPR
jgi:hypothetical protein